MYKKATTFQDKNKWLLPKWTAKTEAERKAARKAAALRKYKTKIQEEIDRLLPWESIPSVRKKIDQLKQCLKHPSLPGTDTY